MKYLVLTFFIISISLYAQEGYKFCLKYSPSSQYRYIMKISSKNDFDFTGTEEQMKIIKEKGLKFPLKMEQEQEIVEKVTTSEINPSGVLNLLMEIEKITQSNKVNGNNVQLNKPDLSDLKIFARVSNDTVMTVDSIQSKNINNQVKEAMSGVLQNLLKSVKYPDKKLKVGDKFVQEIPMTIPIQGVTTINFKVKTNYTLTKVENGLGYFSTIGEFIMENSASSSMQIEANGNSTGELIHDLTKNQFVTMKSETKMSMSVKESGMKFNQSSNISSEFNVESVLKN